MSGALLAHHDPPVGHLLREVGSNNGDVTLVLFFICITAKRDL